MLEEELQEMQMKVEDARNHLIELNNKYNELLTKEHEEKARKNFKNSNLFPFSTEYENKPRSEEDMMLARNSLWYWIRMLIIFILETVCSLPLLPSMVLIVLNALYSMKKSKKIRKKYANKEGEKKEVVEETCDKDALYEEVFKARTLYHTLRKEYERKKLNADIEKSDESREKVKAQSGNLDPQIYQIYSEYIEYVKNVSSNGESRCLDNKPKIYEIKAKDL